MQDVTIRPERPDEADAIRRLNDAAFGTTTEGRIVDGLRGGGDWIAAGSLVAVAAGGRIVGHALLSRGRLERGRGGSTPIGIIGPVAVLPERQGHGIGAALMAVAVDAARALDLPLVCLLGHAGYYPRFGFEPARALGVEPPQPWPDANWLALRLPGWTPDLRGVVRYPAAFPID